MLLKEKRFDSYDSPVYIELIKINEYPFHAHDEMEILFLLKGTLELKVSGYDLILEENNFFVINTNTLHYLSGMTGKEVALIIHINVNDFLVYYPDVNKTVFICDSQQSAENTNAYNDIKRMIVQMTNHYYAEDAEKDKNSFAVCASILLVLINNFQIMYFEKADENNIHISSTNVYKDKAFQIQRLRRITHYIYDNFRKKLTLADIAKEEHMSKYYISHLIKVGLGTSFQDFINDIRLEESLIDLLGTKFSIEEIAEKCGFSSADYYRKSFASRFKKKPSQYRKEYANKTINTVPPNISKHSVEEAVEIIKEMTRGFQPKQNTVRTIRNIALDLNTTSGKNSFNVEPHVTISKRKELFNHNFIENIKKIKSALSIKHVSITETVVHECNEILGGFAYMNKLIKDLVSRGIEIEISCVKGDEKHLRNSLAEKTSQFFGNSVSFTTAPVEPVNTPAEALIESFDRKAIYINLSALFDAEGLRSRSLYMLEFIKKSSGTMIDKQEDYIITYKEGAYKIIILNDSGVGKDVLLKLQNINKPVVYRTYRLESVGNYTLENWEDVGKQFNLTPDIKNTIERIHAPKAEILFISKQPEKDIFITMDSGEALLIDIS